MGSDNESKRPVLIASVALGLITLALFSRVSSHRFTLDSHRFLAEDARVAEWDVGAIFSTDYWNFDEDPGRRAGRPGLYRPLSLLWLSTFLQIGGAGDARTGVSSAVNWSCLLLHIGATIFRFLLFLRLLGARPHAVLWAFLGALATALHPVTSEVVGTQVGAAEGLAGLLVAAGLWLLVARTGPLARGGVFLCILAALLSKENAAAVAAVAPLFLWWCERRSIPAAIVGSWPVFAAVGGWFLLRGAVLGFRFGVDDPFFAGFETMDRVTTAFAALWSYDLPALFFPTALLPVVTFEDVVPRSGFGSLPVIGGALLFCGIPVAAFLLQRKRTMAAWGLLSAWLFLLPVANVLLSIGALTATRFLYLPLLGLGAVLASASAGLWEDGRPLARGTAALLLVWFVGVQGVWGIIELGAWKDNPTLFEASYARAPQNSWAAFSAGNVRRERGEGAAALEAYRQAVESPLPTVPGSDRVPENILDVRYQAAMNGGLLEWSSGRRAEAVPWFEKALAYAEQGMGQAEVQLSTTTWSVFAARALNSIAGTVIEEAMRTRRRAGELEAQAKELLARAETLDPGNLQIALTRARLPLCRRDQGAFVAGMRSLYRESRGRIAETSHALEVARAWAELLDRQGRKEEAILVKLRGALEGRKWVGDAPSFFNLGMQGSRSSRKETRALARQALEEFLKRGTDPQRLTQARATLQMMPR